uniref:Uncharacterized protein n=1 Tax=Cacopsylla melanoneura TaxID=428564 RepID=A0A8D8TN22_9HEMI
MVPTPVRHCVPKNEFCHGVQAVIIRDWWKYLASAVGSGCVTASLSRTRRSAVSRSSLHGPLVRLRVVSECPTGNHFARIQIRPDSVNSGLVLATSTTCLSSHHTIIISGKATSVKRRENPRNRFSYGSKSAAVKRRCGHDSAANVGDNVACRTLPPR